jgi:putative aldouronate transport system substrate-binding protein
VETQDGKAVFVPATEEYKEAIIWLSKLFREGLLEAEDYAARDRNLFTAKLFSDEVIAGSFVAYHKTDAYAPAERYDDYVRIEVPMKGPRGHQIYVKSRRFSGPTGNFIITNRGARKAPDLIRWLDAHFETTRSMELLQGPIGITMELKPNGMYGMMPTPANTNFQQFRYGQSPVGGVPYYIPKEAWGTTLEVMEDEAERIPWVLNVLEPYMTQFFIPLYPIDDEVNYIQGRGRDINDYVRVNQSRWLMQGGIEQDWNSFKARLKEMGEDEFTKIMQNQIDRFKQHAQL